MIPFEAAARAVAEQVGQQAGVHKNKLIAFVEANWQSIHPGIKEGYSKFMERQKQ